MRLIRRCLGSHPNPFSEGRYWVSRGILKTDFWFISIDALVSVLVITQIVAVSNSELVYFAAAKAVRLAIAARLFSLLRQRRVWATKRWYGWLAFVALLEPALMVHSISEPASADAFAQIFMSHAIAMGSILFLHPITWQTRAMVIVMAHVSVLWFSIPFFAGLSFDHAEAHTATFMLISLSSWCWRPACLKNKSVRPAIGYWRLDPNCSDAIVC